jgi:5'-nucleotidase
VLRLRAVEPGVFAIDGTPADCIYVALHAGDRILPRLPDLCVSGMNHGLNLGVDVFYSGTVAAAREAALRGIPSVAISADTRADREAAATLGARLAFSVLRSFRASGAPRATLFNVNFPPGASWPVRATSLGKREYGAEVVFRHDPRGGEYMWIGGSSATHQDAPGSDSEAYDEGVASVTPLALELFAPAGLEIAADAVAGLGAG